MSELVEGRRGTKHQQCSKSKIFTPPLLFPSSGGGVTAFFLSSGLRSVMESGPPWTISN